MPTASPSNEDEVVLKLGDVTTEHHVATQPFVVDVVFRVVGNFVKGTGIPPIYIFLRLFLYLNVVDR